MKNLMTTILPMVKNIISNKINQIKLGIMQKIPPNKAKKRRNIFKKVSNRRIKSLENNFSVKATRKIISRPKITIDKPQIVIKPKVDNTPKIVPKVKKVDKTKNY